MNTIRIVLADDHRMFREALRSMLADEPGIEIVAEAGNAAETFDCLNRLRPDVLVLDIAMPDMNGIEVARQASEQYPQLRIVALSGYADRLFVENMLQAGALAYVVKSAGRDELLLAIRAAASGRHFLSPEVTGNMLGQRRPGESGTPPLSSLAPRERAVLKLLAQGGRSTDIARELGIKTSTVDTHRRNIKKKLKLSSIADLTRYAIREGLLSS
jgi:DNA-binding NarL/FixJ family response regulator